MMMPFGWALNNNHCAVHQLKVLYFNVNVSITEYKNI